jgi:mono/diheme cytochrome c family protein
MKYSTTGIAMSGFALLIVFALGCRNEPVELLPPGLPQEPAAEFVGDPIDNGEISFALYCVSCHGESGRGDGPVAEALAKPPTDLTTLTARYGGVFPAEEIYSYVDGRKDVAAHGTRQMPVWGNIWSDVDMAETDEESVDIRLRELVAYIRSIQEEM